jgi:hypothetical protein
MVNNVSGSVVKGRRRWLMLNIKIEAPEIVEAINGLVKALAKIEFFQSNKKNHMQLGESKTQSSISLEEIRTKLAALVQSGKQQQVKDLISQYGVRKLTEVPPEKYADLLKALEQIDLSKGV